MAAVFSRELEPFIQAFDIDSRVGVNRLPVKVTLHDRDLLPVFREMGLEIQLERSPEKIMRTDRVTRIKESSKDFISGLALAAVITIGLYSGSVEEAARRVPILLRPWG